MAVATVNVAGLGSPLLNLLMADAIEPGDDIGYQLAKLIYVYHPLGKKLVDTPIALAQSQEREIAIAGAPDRVRERFVEQWEKDGCDGHIFNVASLSRIYGVAAVGLLSKDLKPGDPIDYKKLASMDVVFNVWDALNLAGSQVMNLDPNSVDFLKTTQITVAGTHYHRSRAIVKLNEKPIYLDYSASGYGFTGRSVYQRALFPLKSFIDTMNTDAMVARKAGLIVAKMKPAGSITDRAMQALYGIKRAMIQWGRTENVLGITIEESIESLNLNNINTAMEVSRKNILDNIATAADMPAILLNQETFAEGFGEGAEDAKSVARYIGGVRQELDPLYEWFDEIVMYRAWSPEFFDAIKADFYPDRTYESVFAEWKNAFRAVWPSLIEEPESEAVQVEDVKLKALIATVQVFGPEIQDQANKAKLLMFAQDNINSNEKMFKTPLNLDFEEIANYKPPAPEEVEAPAEPKPFSAQDAQVRLVHASSM